MSQILLATLLLLGDSFGVGMQPYLAPDRAFVRTGASSFEAWERYAHSAAIVLLVIGTNDSPDERTERRFADLTQRLAKGSAALLVAGPPCALAPGLDVRLRAVEVLQRRAWSGPYVALRAWTERDGRCLTDGRTPDGLHFTPQGYAAMAARLRSELARLR